MELSNKAKTELREVLRKAYGEDFDLSLSDEEVCEIGDLLLTVLAEGLKHKIANPELFTTKCVSNSGFSVKTCKKSKKLFLEQRV